MVTKQFPGLTRNRCGRERGGLVVQVGLSEESEGDSCMNETSVFAQQFVFRRNTDHDQGADLRRLVWVQECDLVGRMGSLNKLLGHRQVSPDEAVTV